MFNHFTTHSLEYVSGFCYVINIVTLLQMFYLDIELTNELNTFLF